MDAFKALIYTAAFALFTLPFIIAWGIYRKERTRNLDGWSWVIREVLLERHRQVHIHGFDEAYDDANGSLMPKVLKRVNSFMPTSYQMIEAAALLIAEVERRRRIEMASRAAANEDLDDAAASISGLQRVQVRELIEPGAQRAQAAEYDPQRAIYTEEQRRRPPSASPDISGKAT